MGFQHTGGGDTGHGGTRLTEPGWFHFVVEKIEDPALGKNSAPIPNAAFAAHLKVLAGSASGQEDKSHREVFFHPKDGKPFLSADHFFIATNQMTPQQVANREAVNINWDNVVGHQLIAKAVLDDEGKYLKLWSDFYHVDDPAVAGHPKDEASLRLIAANDRLVGKPADYFSAKPASAAPATQSTALADL